MDFRSADQFASIRCPFTNDLLAVRDSADVAILHVQRADNEGNAHVWGNFGVMREAAFAAKKVILTCEEIVDHDLILSDPNRNVIPGFLVSSVVHQPFGSHPSPTQGYARRDDNFYFEYHKATRSREGFEQWLQTWVLGSRIIAVSRPPGQGVEKLKPEEALLTGGEFQLLISV